MYLLRITRIFLSFIVLNIFQNPAFSQVTTATFNCTGAPQYYSIPPCVTTVTVEAWGAGGGGGGIDTYTGSPGGGGAYAYSTLAVTPGQVLTVYVGCGGLQGGVCQTNGPGGAGGYGYGSGGNGGNSGQTGCSGPGGGGGGGSAVLNGATVLVVAGGGGGGGGGGNHGDGGSGGGGGQNGSAASTSAPGGILGASGSANGSPGGTLPNSSDDGAGGGGGGGGVVGGTGGSVAPGVTDAGGGGGGGGTSVGTTTIAASGQTPGNPGSPYLCAGCAVGGNGGSGAPGVPGDVVISYSTPPALTSNISSTNGCTSATATVTPTSGTTPYTYTWTPSGGNAATASGLTNGTYNVNFTDAHGCTGSNSIAIALSSTITGTINASPGSCGIATATVTASGGTGAYTYTWSPAGGNAASASIASGTSTVTIADAMGCSGTATVNVVLPPALTLTATQTNVTCNGLSNGSATATASGGSGTYTIAINTTPPQGGISSSYTASGLAAGSYTFGAQDGNGCQTAFPITITQPAVLQQTLTAINPICVGSNSILNDAVAGGTSPYTVTWSSGGSFSAAAGSTTVTPASTTTYSASVLDANNCANTATVNVTVNPSPSLIVNSPTICVGGSTTLNVSGANTYVWSPGTGLSGTTGNSVSANPVTTTVYTITGTDANTCTATATSTVTVNPSPTVTVGSATICVGATTTLTATGANTFSWANSTGLSATSGTSVNANPVTTTVYTITGTDANTCTATATSTVTVNSLPTVTVTSGAICNGSSMSLTAAGASTYAWANATGLSATTGSNVTANPTTTTNYTVTGTDINNCVNTAISTVTVNLLPVINSNSPSICIGGATTLNASGANTYAWAPATGLSATTGSSVNANPSVTTSYTITGTDLNNCVGTAVSLVTVNPLPTVTVTSATICVGQQTATLTASGANTYTWAPSGSLSSPNGGSVTATPGSSQTYTITGDNGCIGTATTAVTVNPLPTLTVNSATICAGQQTASLTVNGNATGYTWSPGTGLSAATGTFVTATPSSTTVYTITGTDANTCTNTATSTVFVNPLPIAVATSNSPKCAGQTLNFTGSGGLAYAWVGPNSYTVISQNPSIVNTTVNQSGTYTLVVQDINNCIDSATVNVIVNPLPVPIATNNTPICANQTLNFTGSGLTGSGSYVWTGPNSYSVTAQSPAITNAQPNTSGIYTLMITDANNCVATDTTLATVNPLPPVSVPSATTCLGTPHIFIAGGTTGACTWTPGTWLDTTAGVIVVANPPTTTIYTVTGTSVAGCTATTTFTLTVNPLPMVTVNSGTICFGNSTPLQALGANTYAWSPVSGLSSSSGSNVNASPTSTTTYVVTGTDINNCKSTDTAVVIVHPLPSLVSSPPATSGCEPQCVDFSNLGTSSGTYLWNFGDGKTSSSAAPNHCFSKGSYTVNVTLTDSNGCVNKSSSLVTAFPTPKANFNVDPQPTTILEPIIHFTDATTGGALITSWNWDFGDGTGTSTIQNPIYTYVDTGTFAAQLVVTSNLGCMDSITINVVINDEYFIYVPNAFTPNYDGMNDVFLPVGEGVTEYKLWVYDRWGSLAFSSNDILKGWDGRHLNKGNMISQEDVYIWKIEAKNKKGEPKLLKGIVNLIK